MTEPLIKAVIYGTVTGIIYLLWGLLKIGAVGGGLLGGAFGFTAFITAIIGAVIGVFVGAVILLIISSVCKGNADFEANLRVTAAVMVIMPISALLSFLSGFNIYLGMVINLIVFLYTLWLLYNGLVEALKCKPETAKIVCYVLIALIVLFLLLGLNARNRLERSFNKDARELLKDLNKN
jgi:hypothetical protein